MPLQLISGWSHREREGLWCDCFCREHRERGRGSTNERRQRRINELGSSPSIAMPADLILTPDTVGATSGQILPECVLCARECF